ncbi:hypothetical protein MAPG_08999 [Magnaporthiopsis poae ATCC 64411]|uniref:Uncharacterized protein n=1 Tax=Magnaporthiopsis poae (strain ATCC 64411 / 73-15) TaxID=644358 RepID=A0A0C4E8T0_MAGP6|nr:hypothetical protein MAPG_08999 [Magnaporthiopsis poae ATCC 64411]
MRLTICFGLVLGLGLSATAAQIVGSWTMVGLNKACEDFVTVNHSGPLCTYQFRISETAEAAPPLLWCTVSAQSFDAEGKNTTFDGALCREGGAASLYRVHGLWNQNGFITLSVVNTDERVYSNFPYKDRDLEDYKKAPTRTEPSYKLNYRGQPADDGEGDAASSSPLDRDDGFADPRRLAPITGRRLRVGNEPATAQGGCDPNVWIVRNLSRTGVFSEILMHPRPKTADARPVMQTVLFRFDMVRCDDAIHCKFEALGNNFKTVDIKYDNFSDVPCENETDINVSWGYKPDTDGGIMTLKDVSQRRRAFLGWDNVNSRVRIEEEASGVSEVY